MGALSVVEPRALSWTDIGQLVPLEEELFAADAWTAPTWWSELASRPRRDYLVLTDETDAIVAYAGTDHAGETADLMTVAVTPRARGRGLAGRLLDELERRATGRGAAAMLLEVRADNEAAVGLYRGRGYAVLRTRRKYYQPGDVDALVMRKLLGDKEVRNG